MLGLEEHPDGGEISLAVVDDAGRVVHDFESIGGQAGDALGVSCGERGILAGGVRRGGVRSYPALAPIRGSRWCGRELVEAGERLGVAIDVEYLVPCEPTVGSESHEPEVRPFEGATADAIRAEVRPTPEERVGSYGKDVIDAKRDALCHLGPRS